MVSGSFGLLGGIAGVPGQQTRSPATDHHLDVLGSRRDAARVLRDGWREYTYEMVPARVSKRQGAPSHSLWLMADRRRYVLTAADAQPPNSGATRQGDALGSPWYTASTVGADRWSHWYQKAAARALP